jgi:nicotinamide-nucleotide amidase
MTNRRDISSEGLPVKLGENIDCQVAALFRETGLTLALAESCSGGLIAKRITDIPGSSAYFLFGAVTYADSAKERILGVPAEMIASSGAVSPETAIAMATGVRTVAGSDIGLSVTGIAGPDGGTPDKPVGTVYIAVVDGEGCEVDHHLFSGERETVRSMTAEAALEMLYQRLLAQRKNKSTDYR